MDCEFKRKNQGLCSDEGMCGRFSKCEAKEESKSDWVRIEDEFPEDEVGVIAYTVYGNFELVFYDKFCDEWKIYLVGDFFPDEITHWMSLPEPPKQHNESG